VSRWRRCDRCRKVRSVQEYDGETTVCSTCLAAPAARRRTATVTRTPAARTSASPADGPRRPLLGTVGSGDLEVRERRARRAAQEQLAEVHTEEFEQLLHAARRAEGLRA